MSTTRHPRTPALRAGRRPGRALATATVAVLLLGAPATAGVLEADGPATPFPAAGQGVVEPSVEPSAEPSVEPSVEPVTDQPTDHPTTDPLPEGPVSVEPVEQPVPQEPVSEQPVEEPVGEQPAPEEPTTDAPTTDAPAPPTTDLPVEAPAAEQPEAVTEDESTELACASDGPLDVQPRLVRHAVVEVTWAPPTAVCGREVLDYRISLDGQVETGYHLQYSGLSWQMSAEPGPHTVSVVAVTTDGPSQPTSTTFDMPDPGLTWPSAPTGVTVVQTGADEVTITWSAPALAGSSAVAGYDVGVATAGWGNGFPVDAGTRSSVQGGLEPGVLYYLSVAAENDSGTGPRTFVEFELASWEAPSAPRALTAAQSGPGEVTVEWVEPADAGSHPVSGYRVEVTGGSAPGLAGAATVAAAPDHPADARRATVTGLGVGVHEVHVSALNVAGSGEVASARVTVLAHVVDPSPEEADDPPTGDPDDRVDVVGRAVDRSVATGPTGQHLARTGADAGVLALGALLATALGAGLMVSSRRRSVGAR